MLFYTRTPEYVRGAQGEIATVAYESPAAEDETWDRPDAKPEWFYVVGSIRPTCGTATPARRPTRCRPNFPNTGCKPPADPFARTEHHDDHDHDHDHDRTVKPMVDEITDFEVLEIALRELCIEKGIFTAEEHRHFTEFAEQIGPTPGGPPGRPGLAGSRFQEPRPGRADDRQQAGRRGLVRTHRFRYTERLHRVRDPGRYP